MPARSREKYTRSSFVISPGGISNNLFRVRIHALVVWWVVDATFYAEKDRVMLTPVDCTASRNFFS
jgi:hypothetical protein